MALPPGFESHPTHLQPRDWTLDLSRCPLPPQVRVRGVLHRMRQHTRSTGYNTVDTRRPGCLVTRKPDALSAVAVGPLRSRWGRICAGGAPTPGPPWAQQAVLLGFLTCGLGIRPAALRAMVRQKGEEIPAKFLLFREGLNLHPRVCFRSAWKVNTEDHADSLLRALGELLFSPGWWTRVRYHYANWLSVQGGMWR